MNLKPSTTTVVLRQLQRLPFPQPVLEFLAFGYKEARACIFAGSFFGLLFLTTKFELSWIERYDLLLVGAVAIQAALLLTKIESLDECKVILVFHILGFALETFKTHPSIGSWSYPEDGFTKIGTVPLYSGFMYSAVGSYISQAWRLLNLKMVNYPKPWLTVALSLAIYLNFFTNAFVYDFRNILLAMVVLVFWRTRVYFTPMEHDYWMPLWFSFGLVAFFVWIAENVSTFFEAWQYPNQSQGWAVVDFHKITSWSLLVIISFVLIINLKHVKKNSATT